MTRKFLKKLLSQISYYLRLDVLVSRSFKPKLFIINYHGIAKRDSDNFSYHNLLISPEDFEQQLSFLKKRGHTFINFSDLDKYSEKELTGLNKPTIIYFDDGFANLKVEAVPILKKYRAKATIFVNPKLVDGEDLLWTIKYRQFLKSKSMLADQIEEQIAKLKGESESSRNEILSDLYSKNNFAFDSVGIFLNWLDLKNLSLKDNIEIGCHGFSHRRLTDCSDDELIKEIFNAKKIIENNISGSVFVFSYPYGRYNQSVVKILDKTGYHWAVSGGQGVNNIMGLGENRFELKNIPARVGDNLQMFSFRLYFNFLKK